jgi:16S rRNA (cytidine1402-2'-O)-methyltransferase
MESKLAPLAPGTLYLVATPSEISKDITLRALRTLKECDLVAVENTRRSDNCWKHFGISSRCSSYFRFNEAKRRQETWIALRGERLPW